MQETRVWSLDHEDPLEKGRATHTSILAWRISRTEEPGGLQSMGLQRVRRDWVTKHRHRHRHRHRHTHTHTHTHTHWLDHGSDGRGGHKDEACVSNAFAMEARTKFFFCCSLGADPFSWEISGRWASYFYTQLFLSHLPIKHVGYHPKYGMRKWGLERFRVI